MSVSVSVQSVRPPQDRDTQIKEPGAGAETLVHFETPTASDGLFGGFYASVAADLGLPLLSGAYASGLKLSRPADLTQLLSEVAAVEAEWLRRDLLGQWRDEVHGPGRRQRLQSSRPPGSSELATEEGGTLILG
ncbi:hypothetical protein K7W42_00095 [Deinococcus sp. HMF7604]|uniref:hypothetical protein n=1 Tax=Deinococcus betulae TaxID=2873312 RepID=UPI001CCD4F74|nr:hypothetical protein [Deinococcus betulae]MBZ9749254.1 hypothetical protein [Deinococcus betulae]